ncbi:MAG: SDR family oxidoreductase [Planctomycetota bacterium]
MTSTSPTTNPLHNQNVIVTGGATGIGYGIAEAFALQGANVAIGSRRPEIVQQAVSKLQASASGRVIGFTLDVTDRENSNAFVQDVLKTLGSVDILVNAAGVNIKNRSMAEMLPEQWDQVLAINATGAYNLIHASLPAMRHRQAGLIINISSVTGKRALALGGVAYAASKFAMTALGTCVANEVGPEGIRVTNIYPGEVDTPILDQRPVPVTTEQREKILRPSDVGQIVVSIASLPARAHIPELVIKPVHQSYF